MLPKNKVALFTRDVLGLNWEYCINMNFINAHIGAFEVGHQLVPKRVSCRIVDTLARFTLAPWHLGTLAGSWTPWASRGKL